MVSDKLGAIHFHLIRAFAPGMRQRSAGRSANFATIVSGGEYGQADYAAAKAAVASLTRSLAAELAPAITVNAVVPGLTRTTVTQNMPEDEAARLLGAHSIAAWPNPKRSPRRWPS